MRLPEQRLWDAMLRNCSASVRVQRIENIVASGMPDVISIFRGRVCLVELKAREVMPVRADTPLLGAKRGLNQDQMNWHRGWSIHDGISYVLISAGARHKHLLLIPGECADLINRMTLVELRDIAVASDWEGIQLALRGQR